MIVTQKDPVQSSSPQISLEDLLAVLRQQDVFLWIDESDRLRYRAAKDALTPELTAQLKEHKAEILEFLRQAKRSIQSAEQSQIVPIERTGKLPVSFNQQQLWLLEQFDPGKAVYNLPLAYRFEGTLDIEDLHLCLQEIVQRQEVLRSTFHVDNSEPYQTIVPTIEVSLPIIDLQHLPEAEREEGAKQIATERAKEPFSLEEGPLFRFELLRLSPKEHLLVYNTHHIISDGWSSEVFFKELTALYQAFSSNQPSPLAELPIQYVDCTAWQRRWLADGVLQTQLGYWKQVLAGDLPVLQLPTDHPRPAKASYRGEIGRKMLPEPLTNALKEISKQGNTTLSMTLMTAFKILLYRYSGQEDIIVGSPIAGRNRLETEGLIGFFVNTIVFRTDLSGNPSFREALEQVRQVSLGAYANQDVPFDQLVREIRPERDPSRAPIFQAMFAMNAPWTQGSSRKLSDMTITSTFGYVHNSSSSFDLTLVTRDTGKGLRVSVEYSLDLFEASTIERMISHFQTLLEGIIANPDQSIAALPLLPQAERHQLLEEWNQTQVEYPSTACLHQLIEVQVEKTPEAVAVIAGERCLTYRDLNDRANQLAYFLQQHGVSADVPVALYVERSLEFAIGVLGTLKAGGAYIPIDSIMPAERRLDILQDAKPPVILTQSHLASSLPTNYEAQVIYLDSDWATIAGQSFQNLVCQTTPDNLAYIIYTSGSTGKPKGVGITHRGVVNHGLASAKLFELTPQDRVLQFSTISFDICIEEVFPTWLTGATLILRSEAIASSIAEFLQFIDHHQITIANLPTAFWHELVNGLSTLQRSLPQSLRLMIVGGEKPNYSTYKTWLSLVGNYPRWLNGYGPTETTVTATFYDPSTDSKLLESRTEIPIGRPLANLQTYILDSNLQPVPIGVPGELFIGGSGLAKGYLNRPELTAEKFITHPFQSQQNSPSAIQPRLYRTGDRVRYLPDGNIEFLGRLDNQVKIRGFRIELGEIESTLALHPAIVQSVVTVRVSDSGQKQLIAYIVTDPQQPIAIAAIRMFLKDKLPDYMIPVSFVELEALPLTPNGKINTKALPEPVINASSLEIAIANDDFEKDLVAIWQEVLEVPSIGIHDNFFDLGGHSLLAVRLFTVIEKKFSQNLPLATLLQAPTIHQLADILRQEQPSDGWSPLVAIKPDGSRPPLFCIHGGGFNVLIYRDLALKLSPDQPVYGLQAQGLHGRGGIGSNSLEDIAADYINEIRAVQPHGPYHLAGLSNGGNIALEMAQQLQAQGEQVNFVGMFDCYAPGGIYLLPTFPRFLSSLSYALQHSLPRLLAKMQHSKSDEVFTKLQELIKALRETTDSSNSEPAKQAPVEQKNRQDSSSPHSSVPQESWIEQKLNRVSLYILKHSPWSFFNPSDQLGASKDKIAETLKDLEKSYKKAYKAYVPKPYYGKITLFRAKECPPGYRTDPYLGWYKLAKNGIEIYKIPGHHTSMMSSPVLAQKLESCLKKISDDSCSS